MDFDYERGLDVLKRFAEGTDWYGEFTPHETVLRDTLADERLYGPGTETTQRRFRTINQLNRLSLKHLNISFNGLCMGQLPATKTSLPAKVEVDTPSPVKGDETSAPSGPAPVYGKGRHWAVIVGVNDYEDTDNYGQLSVCVKDAKAVYQQLIVGGFESGAIRLLTDDIDDTQKLPYKVNILKALTNIGKATEPDDVLVFYYSGHGDEDENQSYLVARDGHLPVLKDTAVPMARVKEIMESAPARSKVIVLDACHSGARIGAKGPKPMSAEFKRRVFEQAEGLAILASCTQGQLSYEWQARERSVFTYYLLDALKGEADRDQKGFVTVQDANRHVVDGVKFWAVQHNRVQTPTAEVKVIGDIILCHYALAQA